MNRSINRFSREVRCTADGSSTLYVKELDECYHSLNGAIRESRHVFIDAGLKHINRDRLRVLEIGFGTGLNAFLTLVEAAVPVEYYAIELYPLPSGVIHALNYGEIICPERESLFYKLHETVWDAPVRITDRFTLYKIAGDSNRCEFPEHVDLIYFDAFAPNKQPDMWNRSVFDKLYKHTGNGGVLTTYCAKGSVRRMMKEVGYSVERIAGPPGKREMLRAIKPPGNR
jgi:tRNA U34 5-methylaminomethyl-2-thiouridine-forming methyltransferase MnmC